MSKIASTPSNHLISRRDLLQRSGVGLLGLTAFELSGGGTIAHAAEPKAGSKKAAAAPAALTAFNRFPRAVQEYYIRRVREVEKASNARRAALKTKADAEAYVRDVRSKIQQCFGAMPAKTPLNARVTKVSEREGFRIENVIFDSRPGFPVTANLYVPTGRKGPLPGVIGTCGHALTGKAGDT